MASIHAASPAITFEHLLARLKSFPAPVFNPGKAYDASLSDSIASQYLHPALEALMHLLNQDLASAHFLVRHMQAPPAYESMYVHGILHRIEGDYDNARAWYSNVSDWEGFTKFWGPPTDRPGEEAGQKVPRQQRARDFLDRIEKCAGSGGHQGEELESLQSESRAELESLLDWCLERLGTEMHKDATKDWVKPTEELKRMGEDQVSGSAGPRNF